VRGVDEDRDGVGIGGLYVSICTARVPNGLMSQELRPEGSVIAPIR